MIFITLFWNELATGTALLVPNFLKKSSLKAHKMMSENIQTFENIVVWPHLSSPGATMSPTNVAWLACNHIRTSWGTRRGSCVWEGGGGGGTGARLRFIVRSKPKPSGQRKIFRSSPLLSQATDQCFLSPPLPCLTVWSIDSCLQNHGFTVLEWYLFLALAIRFTRIFHCRNLQKKKESGSTIFQFQWHLCQGHRY